MAYCCAVQTGSSGRDTTCGSISSVHRTTARFEDGKPLLTKNLHLPIPCQIREDLSSKPQSVFKTGGCTV